MKQIIPFASDINLENTIYDITSIALEHNLKMENNDSIVGVFIISGKYKTDDLNLNEEVFEKRLNFDITLDDKYDASKVKIDIDDFRYEIKDETYLRVNIDVLVDNLMYIQKQKPIIKEEEEPKIISLEEIKKDIDKLEERKEEMKENDINKIEEQRQTSNEDNVPLDFTSNILTEEEKYTMYKVHIVRENDTLEEIMEKYSVSKEEIEKYNNIQNVILGTKIIIPTKDE